MTDEDGFRQAGAVVAWLLIIGVTIACARQVNAQVVNPDGGGIRRGVLPRTWDASGPECVGTPRFQVHEYNPDLIVLRESGCSNYEKPFLYLLFGHARVLLLDTGAGQTDVAQVVAAQVDQWSQRNGRRAPQLVVAHTHAHGDHISGDADLKARPGTTVVGTPPEAVRAFFGFRNWPNDPVSFDLGERILDILAIPGHEPSSIAVYDRQTGILFTGDTLYPGRLYVQDAAAFTLSIQRLVDFTRGKAVSHVLGNHIEQTRTAYLDYPIRTVHQPDEHSLELGRAHLLELNEALREHGGGTKRIALRDFTIWPTK